MACIAGVVTYPITDKIISLAPKWGFLDRPDGHHKKHKKPVALGGGLAIFIGATITFGVEYLSSSSLQESLSQEASFLGGLLLAGAWIVVVGLVDDRYGMPGKYKLLGQLVAALIVVASDLKIEGFSLFGYDITLGSLSIPFTIFWLLGAINSLNLLDGIDGLATTIGLILCSTIMVMALMINDQNGVAMVAAVFVGSLCGFFRFNFPPAVIYLGDAGSMLIGLVVGSLAIGGSLKSTATVGLAAPLAIWALPMFDSFTAIVRRKLTGRSIYATDRGHLHHRLMALFGKNTYVLAAVAVCCAVTCGGALLSMFMKSDLLALGAVLTVLCILIATQAFGHVEFKMLMSRLKGLLLVFFRKDAQHETSFQLQGSREWNLLWQSVVEFAEKMQLVDVKLDINLASIQESFHASWMRPSRSEKRERWRTELPLFSDHHVVGRLVITGSRRDGVSTCQAIDQLMELLEPLEAEIIALASPQERKEAVSETIEESQNESASDTPPQVSVS